MSPETKKQALDKVSKFTVKIGYPQMERLLIIKKLVK
jgi:putative endopeptidase